MVITHKVNMDLIRRGITPRIDIVQDDRYSRNLNIRLYENGVAFLPPDGCHALIRYSKPDRTGGAYDAMPDGTETWKIEDNELTIGLAPQVCTVSGTVRLMVSLLCGNAELSTFAIELNVQAQVCFKGDSQEYINIKCYVPQPQSAKVGAYLRVKAVDDQGRIQAVETAAPDSISDDHMNALIDAKLGVIENGAY